MTLDAEDIQRIAAAVVERLRPSLPVVAPTPFPAKPYTTAEMMALLNCAPKSASKFWNTVHTQRVPFTRINARKVVFHRAAVDAWLAKRARHAVSA